MKGRISKAASDFLSIEGITISVNTQAEIVCYEQRAELIIPIFTDRTDFKGEKFQSQTGTETLLISKEVYKKIKEYFKLNVMSRR